MSESAFEAIGMVVSIEKAVGRAARMREQCVQLLLLNLGIVRYRSRVPHECGDFISLHALDHIRISGGRGQRLWNRQRVTKIVGT